MKHQSRETAFKVIYQIDMGKNDLETALEHTMDNDGLSMKEQQFCRELATAVQDNLAEIDEIIQRNMTGWTVSRLMSVDRSLLRLAVYEMLYCGHIAPKGAIDEAIVLAKLYGQKKSSAFINSVLDKVLINEARRENIVTEAATEVMAEEEGEVKPTATLVVERELTVEEAESILKEHRGAVE